MGLRHPSEWRTLLLLTAVYLTWAGLLWNPMNLPLVVQILTLIPVLTLHSSLQHECLHGHPLTSQRLNDALVTPPLGLFIPYQRFKASHIRHHHAAELTVPGDDPESGYLNHADWQRHSRVTQALLNANNTLLGRVVLGPWIGLPAFLKSDWLKPGARAIWVRHLVAVTGLLTIITTLTGMPAWGYLLAAYGGYSLLTVRTFLEHQADEDPRARTVLIDDQSLFRLLFLNNNLHAVHHAYPNIAWYELPALFARNRGRFLALNRHYYFPDYRTIWRRYLLHTKEPVAYPLVAESGVGKNLPSHPTPAISPHQEGAL